MWGILIMLTFTIEGEDLIKIIQEATASFGSFNPLVDNLRNRTDIVRFDSLIRGKIGEFCIRKWLEENGMILENRSSYYSIIHQDIDIGLINKYQKHFRIEVKTSLIPDIMKNYYDKDEPQKLIDKLQEKFDIKIIKNRDENSILDVHSDIFIQIYFNRYSRDRDNFLNKTFPNNNKGRNQIFDLNYKDIEKLGYTTMKVGFISWIDKASLVEMHKNLSSHVYFVGNKKPYWCCNMKLCKEPEELIPYLNSIK